MKFQSFILIILLTWVGSFSQAVEPKFKDDPWLGFDYQEMGLTQFEFQKVKESGMEREKLIHLLEIGIYPREYFESPWLKLGVDEETWIEQRAEGLSDEDIDRSYDLATQGDQWALASAFVPSYYQWKTNQVHKAVAINIWTVGTLGSWAYFQTQDFSYGRKKFLYLALLGNLYSVIDGFLDNKEATDPNIGLSLWQNEHSEPYVQINWRF